MEILSLVKKSKYFFANIIFVHNLSFYVNFLKKWRKDGRNFNPKKLFYAKKRICYAKNILYAKKLFYAKKLCDVALSRK